MLKKTLESPLDCKEIQPVHSKGDQSWVFFGRNDAKAETPVLWPPHAKSWLIGKDSDAGRDWGQEEKGTTEDEMVGWHHWLSGHESEWTPGVGDGREAWRAAVHGVAKSQTRLSAWADCASSVSTWGKACASSCHVAQHILDISGQVSLPPSLPSLFLAFLRDLPFVCLFILFYFTMYSKPSNIVCTYLSLFLLTALFAIFFRFQGTIKEIV